MSVLILQSVYNENPWFCDTKKKTPLPESASELCRPSDRRFLAKLVPTFADSVCHVVISAVEFSIF
jgi:hypothetical protein